MDNDNKTGGKGLSTDEFIHQLMTKLKTRPDSTPPYRSLLIFSTPRSGSTYYSDVLSSAGQIGECREWFNFRYMKAYCNIFQLQDLNFDKYLEFIRAKTSNNTGTFAVNMHIDHFIYEDFTSQDNLKYFERPLEKLGLNMPLENLHTQLSKQADQHSEKLIEEYKQALFNSYQESRP